MSYRGICLSSQFKNGRTSGEIKLSPRELKFTSREGENINFPHQGLRLSWGGTGNRQIFFNHPQFPDVGISCADKTIFKDDCLKRHPFVAHQADLIKKRRLIAKFAAFLIIAFIIAVPATIITFKNPIIHGIVDPIPAEKITEYTRPIADQYLKTAKLIDDPLILEKIEKMTASMRAPLEQEGYDFRFYVVDEPSFNAMAFPDGTIVIHSGLFDKTSTDAQVQGVLAHEISHVTQKHQVRGLAERAGVLIIASAIMGDVNGLFDVVIGGGAQLYLLKNSRDFEKEADEVGLELMHEAQLNPQGMVQTFELMGEEAKKMDMKDFDFLSTHPSSPERVRYLKEKADEISGPFIETQDLDFIKKQLKKHKEK